jgi:hypothetical protein
MRAELRVSIPEGRHYTSEETRERAMPESELKLFKRCVEFQPREEYINIPPGTRGIYALLRWRPRRRQYDVVYVGMARTSARGRIRAHLRSRSKGELWTHFSIFEVFDNVRGEEIQELEGLLRHIYRLDPRANRLNVQRAFAKLRRIRARSLDDWWEEA